MRKLLFSLFIFVGLTGFSQKLVEITGQVKDSSNNEHLEFCSISLVNAKDSIISGTVTDTKGFFSLNAIPGVYSLKVSFVGYKTFKSESFHLTTNKFYGIIKLPSAVQNLNEISVTAKSNDILVDKDTQIITDSIKNGTSSAKEVLDKLNGVDYDRYNNSIKVDNSDKVIILVDGIEKDQEYVKNISPNRLKKVEVIRDPGGRYALEGYTAIINIILNKDYQGTEIFLSGRSMADPDASRTSYIPVQNNVSATVNYTYQKLNIYLKYSIWQNNFNLQSKTIKSYDNGLEVLHQPMSDNKMNTFVLQQYQNYTLGTDFYLNSKQTISYETTLSRQPKTQNTEEADFNILTLMNGNQIDQYYGMSKNSTSSINSYHSLFYDYKINDKNSINSNFTFSKYSDNSQSYTQESNIIINQISENNKNSTNFYTEYNHNFKSSSLQIGYGNSWQKQDNIYSIENSNSTFTYSDFRHKFYSYYSIKAGKKLNFKFGGAAETSNPKTADQEYHYFTFQPYADILLKANKALDIKLKYRAKTQYPSISQTNPFETWSDPYTVRFGNPKLSPNLTHIVSMQTNILGGFITLEPYYQYSPNYIADFGTLRADSIFEYHVLNDGKFRYYGIKGNINIPLGKKFVLQNNVDIFDGKITMDDFSNHVRDWSMSSQLIYINQKKGTVAGLQYQNNLRKFISAQGYNMWDNDFWIVFVQQPFFKQRLSVMLIYFTPITWGVDFNQGSYIKTKGYTETSLNDISLLKNIVMVEINYRFNKGKSVKKKEKYIEHENENKSRGLF